MALLGRIFPPLVAGSVGLGCSAAALACAVCAGDPESPLTEGAQQGVLTMLVITYFVVLSLGAMLTLTVVRARRREKQ